VQGQGTFLMANIMFIPWAAASSGKRPRAFRVIGHYYIIIRGLFSSFFRHSKRFE
jgi:hypothetical protein